LLNSTFHLVDTKLSELAAADGTHSGCTAVTAFLRLEDADGNAVGAAAGVGSGVEVKKGELQGRAEGALQVAREGEGTELSRMSARAPSGGTREDLKNKIKAVLKGKSSDFQSDASASAGAEGEGGEATGVLTPTVEVKGPAEVKKAAKRTLYTANVGDARAVLS
jgi:protein phosphatase PTC1